jgi:hypothetical protein
MAKNCFFSVFSSVVLFKGLFFMIGGVKLGSQSPFKSADSWPEDLFFWALILTFVLSFALGATVDSRLWKRESKWY